MGLLFNGFFRQRRASTSYVNPRSAVDRKRPRHVAERVSRLLLGLNETCTCRELSPHFSSVTLKVIKKVLSTTKVGKRGDYRILYLTLGNDEELEVRLAAFSPHAERLSDLVEERAVMWKRFSSN